MKINEAQYIKSAPSLHESPDFQGLPEIVFVGRSNVGKSSLINSLTNRKNLARTSNTPGKTRYINFYHINYGEAKHELIMVDLPGYGYAKVSKSEQEAWRRNLENFLTQRKTISLIVQIMDIRHGPQANDLQMLEWLRYQKLPIMVVLTKSDKITGNEMVQRATETVKETGLPPNDVICYSSETHRGRDTLWRYFQKAIQAEAVPT